MPHNAAAKHAVALANGRCELLESVHGPWCVPTVRIKDQGNNIVLVDVVITSVLAYNNNNQGITVILSGSTNHYPYMCVLAYNNNNQGIKTYNSM